MEKIMIMMSEKNYASKNCIKVEKIINTIATQTISIEELAQKLVSGHIVRPGILKGGNSSANWVGQQSRCSFHAHLTMIFLKKI